MSLTLSAADLGVLTPGDKPVSLQYGDSNPNADATTPYTTIIAWHGGGFNANIWTPWPSHLPDGFRLLTVNRRGYGDSSAVHKSAEELPQDPEAYGRYLLDTLAFVKYAEEVLKVPARDTKCGAGGIVLLGWSKGCSFLTTILAILASESEPPASYKLAWSTVESYLPLLKTYLKSIILFEPPGLVMGIPLQYQLVDHTLDPAVMGQGFIDLILTTVTPEKAELIKPSVNEDRAAITHDLASWNGVSDAEREEQALKAFSKIPPWLGVGVLLCTGTVIEPCKEAVQWVNARMAGQKNAVSKTIDGGDHFVMVTDPKAFNNAVIACIQELQGKTAGVTASV